MAQGIANMPCLVRNVFRNGLIIMLKRILSDKKALCVMVVVIAHTVLFFRMFPPSLLVENAVPLRVDTSRYFASLVSAAGAEGLFGYDPYQMAGYPAGLWNSMGKKGYELARYLLPGMSLERVLYITLFFAGCVAPLLAGAYLTLFFRTSIQQRLFMILLLIFWHLETMVCYFWQVGNVFFPLGSLLLVCFTVMMGRLLFEPLSLFRSLSAGLLGAFLFYTHTVLLVPVAFVAVVLFVLAFWDRRIDRFRFLSCAIAFCVCLFLSLPWLFPLIASRSIAVPVPWPMFEGGLKYLIMDLFSDRVYQHHFDRQFLFHLALVSGLAGGWLVLRDAKATRWRAVLVGALVCLMIAYGFPLVKLLPGIQPYRFRLTAVLFLLPLATLAIATLLVQWRTANRSTRWCCGLMLLVMLPAFAGYFLDMAYRQPMRSSLDFRAMFESVRALPGNGRLLVDDIALGHLMPHYTGRAILGGLSTQAFVAHGFAGIDDRGVLFGKPVGAWTAESLSGYLRLYAVEYLVLQRSPLIVLAERHPDQFEFLWQEGEWKVFRFLSYAGYDMAGDAVVKADYNEILVERGSSPQVVVLCHWDEMLKSKTPGFLIEPLSIEGMPLPFIHGRFADGVEHAVIGR